MNKNLSQIKLWLTPILVLVGLGILWEIWVDLFKVPIWQLPSPSSIGQEMFSSWSLLWIHTAVTLQEVIDLL